MTKCIHIFFEFPYLKCEHDFDTAKCGSCDEYMPFKADYYDEDTLYDAKKINNAEKNLAK